MDKFIVGIVIGGIIGYLAHRGNMSYCDGVIAVKKKMQ